MDLTAYPRRIYTDFATPIQHLEKLSNMLGGPNIYVKRDDLLGLTGGGNKTRKLEFLVADALKQDVDTLITTGGVQSNHCRMTLAAAVKEGLKCRLVIEERNHLYNPKENGNVFLYNLLGAEQIKVVPDGTDVVKEMEIVNEELNKEGRKGYIVAEGGGNDLGALGYVSGSQEILKQTSEMGISLDHIISPSGSGGTHAGLVTGFCASGIGIPVTGINVRRDKAAQEEKVYNIVNLARQRIGFNEEIPKETVKNFDDYLGPGYAIPTDKTFEAIQLLAQTEGILLDPVYTGKTMAGLIDLVQKGYFEGQKNILFLHTGGTPSIYANASNILEHSNLYLDVN
ncbi:D-cysteine desulfhydrase [Chengkuizengella sp. SCS-71B]|uniref:D-cysteine desulfhydrase n=1 Tax=Chengkuizengella sp. SCS-71B TaxID=3115290 RepID=UPI0032C2221F